MTTITERLATKCADPIFMTNLQTGLLTEGPWFVIPDERSKINSFLRFMIGSTCDDTDGVREHLTNSDSEVAWINAIGNYVVPVLREGWELREALNGKEPQSV